MSVKMLVSLRTLYLFSLQPRCLSISNFVLKARQILPYIWVTSAWRVSTKLRADLFSSVNETNKKANKRPKKKRKKYVAV